jgi:hypothetical protein
MGTNHGESQNMPLFQVLQGLRADLLSARRPISSGGPRTKTSTTTGRDRPQTVTNTRAIFLGVGGKVWVLVATHCKTSRFLNRYAVALSGKTASNALATPAGNARRMPLPSSNNHPADDKPFCRFGAKAA